VPIVPACGGQPEIVDHQVSGFLCHDADAVVGHSVHLANDEHVRHRMSRQAQEKSMTFGPAVFDRHVGRRLEEALRGVEGKPSGG